MGTVPSSQLQDVEVTNVPEVINTDLVCRAVDILNNTAKLISVIQYDNGEAGKAYVMPINSTYHIEGIENANQIRISNATDSNAVTVPYRFYA